MSEGNVDGEAFFPISSDALDTYNNGSQRLVTPTYRHETTLASGVFKRILDVVGALLLIAGFSPLIAFVVLVLKREGGGILFRHQRVGKHGELFQCLKFRTMVPNADRALTQILSEHAHLKEEWLRDHKLKDDPRVTRMGKFLRRTSLDELPQLWNVLRGDMSLVGPRPVVREELIRYGRMASFYTSTRPGLTGLWQTSGRNQIDYRRRVAMDVYYVKNRTLLLDLYILLITSKVVITGHGAY